MKPGALLINVSRGPVVDEAALIDALREGRIGGAALDVFATQPLPPDHPFFGFDNVILTPHMAGHHRGQHDAHGHGRGGRGAARVVGKTPREPVQPAGCAALPANASGAIT